MMIPLGTDQDYLRGEQYKDSRNLGARAGLHQGFSTNTYGWQRWVFDQLENLPPDAHARARVVELGCGPGWLWRENVNRVPAGWHVTLTDLSPGMIAEAQAALADSGRAFAFDVVDAQSLPYDDAALDAVVANHMLYHVPDRHRALAEIARALKPGGRLIAATNGAAHMQELFDLIGRFIGDD
ncbi:MAG: class I SAM-dependent methyltransferase, partial [Anaerolineae bacterium]|nr:class I SAM-dependent methyltransferase [Anaerolineae bacterium]